MKIKNKNYYLIALLWLVFGYLCWLAGVYSFSFVSSNWVMTISEYINTTFESAFVSLITTFTLLYIADFILIFLVAIILSVATGRKLVWLVAFLLGALGRTIYGSVSGIIYYMNHYDTLPPETLSWIFQSITAHFIISPLMAWLGVVVGQKYRTGKQA